jgi:hypothetical protein
MRNAPRTLQLRALICLCSLSALIWCGWARAVDAPHADGAFVPPQPMKGSRNGAAIGLPGEEVSRYLALVNRFHVFATFEGKTEALRSEYLRPAGQGAHDGPLQGGETVPVDLAGDALLGPAVADGGAFVWSAGISSIDAQAIRFHVDLSALPPDVEVWVIDPVTLEAFGPYSPGDGGPEQRWLATIFGEEGVLLVRTSSPATPELRLTEYAHIFLSFEEVAKTLSCNINIGCETDAQTLSVATGTAIILVEGGWFCSGTLLNNELTEEHEPFFLTANHCVCTGAEARGTEVYWDYRTVSCESNDAPELDTLPRSQGMALLATDVKLDTTLMRLDSVPAGSYGRTYAGWDTREIQPGESVLTIHYPDATQMRITKGEVQTVNVQENGREKLVQVHWDEGVTEAGSSGACLLLGDKKRVVGTLSQGPQHTCGPDRSGNIDFFGSFRDFYPQVSKYIDSSTPSTEEGQDACREKSSCFLESLFNGNARLLNGFRALRDKLLACGPAGKWVVSAYYAAGPRWADAVRQSELARGICIVAMAPLARVGATLDEAERLLLECGTAALGCCFNAA